jgi:hypothetical protein
VFIELSKKRKRAPKGLRVGGGVEHGVPSEPVPFLFSACYKHDAPSEQTLPVGINSNYTILFVYTFNCAIIALYQSHSLSISKAPAPGWLFF